MQLTVQNLNQLESLMGSLKKSGDIKRAIENIEFKREQNMATGINRSTASLMTIEELFINLKALKADTLAVRDEMTLNMIICLAQGDTLTRAAERSLDALLDAMRNFTDQNK